MHVSPAGANGNVAGASAVPPFVSSGEEKVVPVTRLFFRLGWRTLELFDGGAGISSIDKVRTNTGRGPETSRMSLSSSDDVSESITTSTDMMRTL